MAIVSAGKDKLFDTDDGIRMSADDLKPPIPSGEGIELDDWGREETEPQISQIHADSDSYSFDLRESPKSAVLKAFVFLFVSAVSDWRPSRSPCFRARSS